MNSRVKSHTKRKLSVVADDEAGQLQPFTQLESLRHRHKLSLSELADLAGARATGRRNRRCKDSYAAK